MRGPRSIRCIVAAMASVGLLLTAVSSASGSSTAHKTATAHAAGSSSLTYALDEDIPGWNVNTSAGAEYVLREVENLVLPQTFLINAQLQPYLNTQLMTSATQTSTSPQTIVYKINPKANWSDGQPIDAEDYYYNYAAQSGVAKFKDLNGQAFDDASNTGYSQIKSLTGSAPAGGAACKSATIKNIGTIPCANGSRPSLSCSPRRSPTGGPSSATSSLRTRLRLSVGTPDSTTGRT